MILTLWYIDDKNSITFSSALGKCEEWLHMYFKQLLILPQWLMFYSGDILTIIGANWGKHVHSHFLDSTYWTA